MVWEDTIIERRRMNGLELMDDSYSNRLVDSNRLVVYIYQLVS